MFSGIPIFYDQVYDIPVFDHEARWAIRRGNRCVVTQSQLREDGWHQRWVEGYPVKHRSVCTVVHGVEEHFQIDSLGRDGLCNGRDGDKGDVVDVVVSRNIAQILITDDVTSD